MGFAPPLIGVDEASSHTEDRARLEHNCLTPPLPSPVKIDLSAVCVGAHSTSTPRLAADRSTTPGATKFGSIASRPGTTTTGPLSGGKAWPMGRDGIGSAADTAVPLTSPSGALGSLFSAAVRAAALPRGAADAAVVTVDDLAALPAAVRRYLSFMGVVGRAVIRNPCGG